MVWLGCREHCHVKTVINALRGRRTALGLDVATIFDWYHLVALFNEDSILVKPGIATTAVGRRGSHHATTSMVLRESATAVAILGRPCLASSVGWSVPDASAITGGRLVFYHWILDHQLGLW